MHVLGQQFAINIKTNTSGDILNTGDNIDDEEIFGFSESFFKILPTNMDEYFFKQSTQ